MERLTVAVEWHCERCDHAVVADHEYGESLYAPKGINWCRDADGTAHLFCQEHLKEWMRAVEAANPNAVWTA